MATIRFRFKALIIVFLLFFCFGLWELYFVINNVKTEKSNNRNELRMNDPNKESAKAESLAPKSDASLPNSSLNAKAVQLNFEQELHNLDKFGAHSADSIVIAVQLHDNANLDSFQKFLNSLEEVKSIEKVTLVVSVVDLLDETNEIFSRITFCRYIKLVFPFSMHFFPNTFPGEDPHDCPRDTPKFEAIAKKCNNAFFPDMYSHYREVKFVQMKHHWLWKLNMIYNGIHIFADQQAPVLFLEGNQYVLPDILHCVEKAVQFKNEKCPRCGFVNMGNLASSQDFAVSNQIDIIPWASTKSTLGLVITRDAYGKIIDSTDYMCEFDDFNWSWSLQAALSKGLPDKSLTIQFKTSRVYRLGTCLGMPTAKCTIQEEVDFVQNQYKNQPLFPDELHLTSEMAPSLSSVKPNGGWGDIRDQFLCKQYKLMYQDRAV